MGSLKVMKGVAYTQKRLLQWLREDGCVSVQPKRDEIRCTVKVNRREGGLPKVSYTSASGKPLYNLEAFDGMWVDLSYSMDMGEFDTGICVNNDFNTTKRVVRSSKQVYDLTGKTEHVLYADKPTRKNPEGVVYYRGKLDATFWMYDLPESNGTWDNRLGDMRYMLERYKPLRVALPETRNLYTEASVLSLYDDYLQIGLEGLMVKRIRHLYKHGRSTDWMKLKPEEEKDGIITGFTEGKGQFDGLVGSVAIYFGDGSYTNVSGMDDETRLDITRNPAKYLGQVAQIVFMQRDAQGGYRHPRWGRLHEDKLAADVLESPNK